MTELSARRAATRDKLIDAALGVFAERGVAAASVEELCEAAGFTRGAFYSNFETKDDLCLAVLERQAGENVDATRAAVATVSQAPSADLGHAVQQAVELFLSSQRTDRSWVLAMAELRLYAARESSLRAGYSAFVERTTHLFTALIQDAAADLGYELVMPAPDAVGVLHAVYEHGAIGALIAGTDVSGPERAAQLGAVLRGMLRKMG